MILCFDMTVCKFEATLHKCQRDCSSFTSERFHDEGGEREKKKKNSMMSLYREVCNSRCKSANLPTSHQSPALTRRNFEVEKTWTQAGQRSISVDQHHFAHVKSWCKERKIHYTDDQFHDPWYFAMPHGKILFLHYLWQKNHEAQWIKSKKNIK